MASQAQADSPLPRVRGLVFLGFPLHPAGKPSNERAKNLFEIKLPLLFPQGTRDHLASLPRLETLARDLGPHATLKLVADADHSFHVPVRSGRTDADVRIELLDTISTWLPNGI